MGSFPPSRRALLALSTAAVALLLLFQGSRDPAGALSDDALVAGSVCEAQELKALKEAEPDLEIEIPAEFDKLFPSLSACRSHDAAWDGALPGPIQPIPFSRAPSTWPETSRPAICG